MAVVSHRGLRTALEKLEDDVSTGVPLSEASLSDLSASTVYWARIARQTKHLRRLAVLIAGLGRMPAAIDLLKSGSEAAPADVPTALMYSDAIALENDFPGALRALSFVAAQQPPHARCVKKAIRLQLRLGQLDAAVALARDLVEKVPENIGVLINTLAAADKQEEALSRAREILATDTVELALINACCRALEKLDAEVGEIAAARARLLSRADEQGVSRLWRAQLLERDGDLEGADAEIEEALTTTPGDSTLLKRSAEIALERGYWGRDAERLKRAQGVAPAFSQLAEGIANADLLLKSLGGSLDVASREPARFADIKSPESVFERVTKESPPPDNSRSRIGVAMVAGSLGGYGAERILANSFRLLATQRRFDWIKFYISDFGKQTSKEFYLPLKDIPGSDVVVLDATGRVHAPFSWIWGNQALPAARIFEQLQRDRPAVVHASLEPLNIFAGLAAVLAGVPRIILHTHNMRPTDLHIHSAERFKGCYQALLARPEVFLAGCAQACIGDYIDWLELEDSSKTFVVHNGYEFDEIAPADAEKRAALRAEYGIPPDAFVIGTAIRLTDTKQPVLWVDAAAEIAAQRPGCRFIMFGDGDMRQRVEQRIREKGLTSYFTLPGRITDLYKRLPLLDLFMLSSRTEGLPNSLIEAQAAGVPVVAFDVGGVAETMVPGTTGLLVKEHTVSALASAALRAISDREWRANAGKSGAEFVRSAFGLEKMIATLFGIFSGNQ